MIISIGYELGLSTAPLKVPLYLLRFPTKVKFNIIKFVHVQRSNPIMMMIFYGKQDCCAVFACLLKNSSFL